jgi:phage gpG-like protein
MADNAVHLKIKASLESFAFNAAGYRELLRGPVVRDLVRRAIRVEAQAKLNASQAPPSIPGQGPAVRTGLLRGSITWRPGLDAQSPYVDVGSAVVYAAFVELGTSRMQARPYLRPALDAARATF